VSVAADRRTQAAPPASWTAWQALPAVGRLSEECLAEILDGGQAFRWNRQTDGNWLGQWDRYVCRLRRESEGQLSWSIPAECSVEKTGRALRRYLALDVEWDRLRDRLPWRSDACLELAMTACAGLRLLRQPFAETLLAFLCSAKKQVVQIKQMCHHLALAFGPEVAPGFRALPDWSTLAGISEEDLRRCGLGFRARYIKATALRLAETPDRLETIETMPYAEAREALTSFPGVGEKVADCVLLFGAGRYEAFPVDVWILRAMEKRYGLTGWTNSQIAHFGRLHFGPSAGLAQQFLFAAERKNSKERRQQASSPAR
jgi:N-glycosylase/DNA lyase